ncbi:protein kinase [Streptomyces sp. NBC_01775]|uniref:serine/threonine-protein kinase n=1 Tax=Streptomyces sp. NBC_01775 TaxID=2975939 RepID=UPI002DD80436|nr:protein kinase [Streptomyces sp. NBC_01775]WSB75790.1 protein kinase [Streptomyces sp. NBC_01775]
MPAQPISERYEIIGELGAGGMGAVQRGFDRVLDRPVAIKRIRPESLALAPAAADELAKRFRREARITARIQHPGVPQVYDAVLDAAHEQLYLVMELVDGTSLRKYLGTDQQLPITWAAAVGAQVSTVLSHAHVIPAVHRDLKPDNIIVARGGTVKVLDFGIAAILRTDVTKLTAVGSYMGSRPYMAPEQIQSGQITPQTDLYALGCILHELLSGQRPFNGPSDYEIMEMQVHAAPTPLRQLRADVPAALEDLVLQMLSKSAEQRPADTQEVYERLLPFLPEAGQDPAPEETGPAGAPDPTGVFRHPYAPRSRPTAPPPAPTPTLIDPQAQPVPVPEQLRVDIESAYAQADALMGEERFAQAAEVLGEVLAPAAQALGADNKKVLELRRKRSGMLILGGDYRAALPEFDALADAYARTSGPTSKAARLCRAQAAHARANLGQATVALRELHAVLELVRNVASDASEEAIELRRSIGSLLASQQRLREALEVLEPLLDDMHLVLGEDDEECLSLADDIARIRLALGYDDA